MTYVKNKKHSLVKLTQKSVLLTSIVFPTILQTKSVNAMFNTLSKGMSNPTTSNVKTLVNKFEQFSSSTPSPTLKNTLNTNSGFSYTNPSSNTNTTKPISQPKLIDNHTSSPSNKSTLSKLFSRLKSSSKSTDKATPSPKTSLKHSIFSPSSIQSTNTKPINESDTPQKPTTKPPVAPKPTPKSILLYKSKSDSSNNKDNPTNSKPKVRFNLPYDGNNSPTHTKTEPIYDEVTTTNSNIPTSNKASTYTLKIGADLGPEYDPYKPTPKQQSALESILKGTVASIVKNNLPDGMPTNQPITIQFDEEAGKHLNASLTSFLLRSAITTLNSLDKQ